VVLHETADHWPTVMAPPWIAGMCIASPGWALACFLPLHSSRLAFAIDGEARLDCFLAWER